MTRPTQKPTRKSDSQLRGLKWLLTAGSLAVALMGTRLLAGNDVLNTAVAQPATLTEIIIPAQPPVQMQRQSGTGQITPMRIELAPIPTAAAPNMRPVVRSQSSR